jgi:hypothetical protein
LMTQLIIRGEGQAAQSITGLITADFRGRLTCLIPTQFPPRFGRFSPVFSGL